MTNRRIDIKIKRNDATKVSLKTNFSKPLLVKLAPPRPLDLPKPVPRACIKISPIKAKETII